MLVPVTGRVSDHSSVAIAGRAARLFFRPTRANATAGGLRTGGEVQAELTDASGAFSVLLDNEAEYRVVMDWLLDPDEEAPERRARGFEEWPFTVRPDTGGEISDLIDLVLGNDLVYVAPDAVRYDLRVGLQLNPVTGDLFQRKVLPA